MSIAKVIVGMSGGVDSSVAALLLQQAGYTVEGLFMKNWEEDDNEQHCSAQVDLADAQAVADHLGIKLHTINFAAEYWDNVFSDFLTEYKAGRTPNPDILCNREIKFKHFLNYAVKLGADYIATGHYAGVRNNAGIYELCTALDSNKDQSYFLYTLGQEQLSKTLFPLANKCKTEIRQIAAEAGFVNKEKKDSTGICFIGKRDFKSFLERYLTHNPGDIVNEDGTVLARHDGLMYYTLGQRQGLKIGGMKTASNEPWFVARKNIQDNTLVVVQGVNNPRLFQSKLKANKLSWISGEQPDNEFQAYAKIRYRQVATACTVTIHDNVATVEFETPQRAITPGQSVVFYNDSVCLGGGIIEDAYDK